MLDRKIFFSEARRRVLEGRLSNTQFAGLSAILDEWEKNWSEITPPAQFAYVLATPWLETDATFQPIHEYGNRAYFMRMYDKTGARPHVAEQLGNTEIGDGAKFPGMGLVQSTGRRNARRATKRMRGLGYIDDAIDFEVNPELLMKPEYAVPILFMGMEEGWFTGDTLDKDIPDGFLSPKDEHARYVRARRIINGKDKADKVAGAADRFAIALQTAGA